MRGIYFDLKSWIWKLLRDLPWTKRPFKATFFYWFSSCCLKSSCVSRRCENYYCKIDSISNDDWSRHIRHGPIWLHIIHKELRGGCPRVDFTAVKLDFTPNWVSPRARNWSGARSPWSNLGGIECGSRNELLLSWRKLLHCQILIFIACRQYLLVIQSCTTRDAIVFGSTVQKNREFSRMLVIIVFLMRWLYHTIVGSLPTLWEKVQYSLYETKISQREHIGMTLLKLPRRDTLFTCSSYRTVIVNDSVRRRDEEESSYT